MRERRHNVRFSVENGELKGFLYDRLNAMKQRTVSTGNGRRESYRHKPIPRMSNTMILPGKADPEQVLKATPDGLLVKRMGGGQVNPVNGDFVFEVAEGYLIENGCQARARERRHACRQWTSGAPKHRHGRQ